MQPAQRFLFLEAVLGNLTVDALRGLAWGVCEHAVHVRGQGSSFQHVPPVI